MKNLSSWLWTSLHWRTSIAIFLWPHADVLWIICFLYTFLVLPGPVTAITVYKTIKRMCKVDLYFVAIEIQGQSKDSARWEQCIKDKTMNHHSWRGGSFADLPTLFFPSFVALGRILDNSVYLNALQCGGQIWTLTHCCY